MKESLRNIPTLKSRLKKAQDLEKQINEILKRQKAKQADIKMRFQVRLKLSKITSESKYIDLFIFGLEGFWG